MWRPFARYAPVLAFGFGVACAPAPGSGEDFERISQALSVHQGDLIASDGASNDNFGYAIAISGDTAIVGTPFVDGEEGGAYVFVRSGSAWVEQQRLLPTSSDGKDWFGYAVAVEGDTVLIGAPHQIDSVKQTWPSGRALVFTRSGGSWTQTAVLTASPQQATDNFGHSVALAGDMAVVDAPGYGVSGSNGSQGVALVFRHVGDKWSRIEQIYAADRAVADGFGATLAATTDTLIVGVPYANIGTSVAGIDQGAAYIYVRSGDLFAFDEKLTLAGGMSTRFGSSVSLSGTTALIGAAGPGTVHAFDRLATGWTWQAELMSLSGVPAAGSAYVAAISGATALVGVPYDKAGTSVTQGVAYRFTREGSAWSYRERLTDEREGANRLFGYQVALSAGTAVIGAVGDTVGTNKGQGAAHVFLLEGSPNGASCASGATCSSGICATQVCCNVVCEGACVSCLGSATGLSTGTCAPVPNLCPDPSGTAGAGGEGGAGAEGGTQNGASGHGQGGALVGGASAGGASAGGASAGGRSTGGASAGGAPENSAGGEADSSADAGEHMGPVAPLEAADPSQHTGCGCRLPVASSSASARAWLLGVALFSAYRRRYKLCLQARAALGSGARLRRV